MISFSGNASTYSVYVHGLVVADGLLPDSAEGVAARIYSELNYLFWNKV